MIARAPGTRISSARSQRACEVAGAPAQPIPASRGRGRRVRREILPERDRCPARAEYDKALSDLFETIGVENLVEDCLNVINDRFVVALREFAKKYPDPPRPKQEVAA